MFKYNESGLELVSVSSKSEDEDSGDEATQLSSLPAAALVAGQPNGAEAARRKSPELGLKKKKKGFKKARKQVSNVMSKVFSLLHVRRKSSGYERENSGEGSGSNPSSSSARPSYNPRKLEDNLNKVERAAVIVVNFML